MPMTINTAWLLEYLDGAPTPQAVLEALPKAGLEIEELHDLQQELAAVRVGFIRSKQPIAGTAGMYACQIEIAKGKLIPVVCASEHPVEVGWGVPVAVAGVTLPTGAKIHAGQVHGQPSEGMICLDGEMGLLARGTGMFHTTDESLLGKPITGVAPVKEHLAVLNVLPNRPDFLGMIGIAREVAAILGVKLKHPTGSSVALAPSGVHSPVQVEIQEPTLCTRYMGGVVKSIRVEASPAWLKAKLLISGVKPRNNVVDITNFVLFEYGQPLHAFDLDQLHSKRIVVRRMKSGESLKLLGKEGVTVAAKDSQGPLVIADADRPVALAGVMGGLDSETTQSTGTVLLEAAHFDAVNIRRTVRGTNLGLAKGFTDSSYRFERGTDPNAICERAFRRALQLLTDHAGGTVAGPATDVHPTTTEPRTFKLDAVRVSSYLGFDVPASTIISSLRSLGMEVTDDLSVRVPTWRVDVNDPVVLIEDVGRLVGYDKVPVKPSLGAPSLGKRAATDALRRELAEQLVSSGFFECRNPTLEANDQPIGTPDDKVAVTLANAATKEMRVLRRTLLSGLARVVDTNLRRGVEGVRFFEMDRAFNSAADVKTPEAGVGIGEWRIGVIAGGLRGKSGWRGGEQAVSFYDLKGTLEDLLDRAKVGPVSFEPAIAAPFVRGTAARVVGPNNLTLGWIGEVDAAVLKIDRLPFKLYAFELSIDLLRDGRSPMPQYQPLARFPAATRDLALVVKDSQSYAELESSIRKTAGASLESLRLVDRYQGQQVAAGHQSLAIRLVFRDPSRTLTADEVAATTDAVVAELKKSFGAELRA
ncbi:MAG: phenylalanine--tRNA ligase subunit beta [Tepidisphaeraceae bacterium]